jgi:hypothetical protein
MTLEDVKEQKDIQFHAGSVAAWYASSLEYDKSLLALSAAGIGLLLTLLTTDRISSVVMIVLYIAAILFFLACVLSVLAIFRGNRTHIEQVLSGKPALDPILTVLDHVAITSFVVAVILTAVIGISTAVDSYSRKGKNMSEENKQAVVVPDFTKSFNGVGNLQSTASAPPAPAQAAAPAPAPAQVQQASDASSSAAGK